MFAKRFLVCVCGNVQYCLAVEVMSSYSSLELGEQGFVALRTSALLHQETQTLAAANVAGAGKLVEKASKIDKLGVGVGQRGDDDEDDKPKASATKEKKSKGKSEAWSLNDNASFALVAGIGISSSILTFIVLVCVLYHYSTGKTVEEEKLKESAVPVEDNPTVDACETQHIGRTPEGSEVSISQAKYEARLEEILEQLAHFLRADVRTRLETSSEQKKRDTDSWQYVAAVPRTLARKCICGNSFAVAAVTCESCGAKRPEASKFKGGTNAMPIPRWQAGSLAWWASYELFEKKPQAPAGGLYFDEIIDIHYQPDNPTEVIVHCPQRARNRVFTFRNWKEAKTWASSLILLVEQLNDDF